MRLKQRIVLFICILSVLFSLQVSVAQHLQPPPPEPPQWTKLIGAYILQDESRFYIRENQGRLEMLFPCVDKGQHKESVLFNEVIYEIIPLKEAEADTFLLPAMSGLNARKMRFTRDKDNFGISINAGQIQYRRYFYGPEKGETFRIQPLKTINELLPEALQATPPVEKGTFLEPDLVEVIRLDTTIQLDIRYATDNNFIGVPLYAEHRAFLQRPAAEALVRVNSKLRRIGYGLIIHDAYRPWYVTKMFWDATPPEMKNFVADSQKGSRHNRGCAVDVALYEVNTKEPILFGGDYDEFSERSYVSFPGGTTRERWFREILRQAMEAEGFEVYQDEWWHFDYKDWNKYPILNLTFDAIR